MSANRHRHWRKQAIQKGGPSWLACCCGQALALAIVGALLLNQRHTPLLQHPKMFAIFSMVIVLSAGLGGLGPGLLATMIGALGADYYFLEPRGALSFPGAQVHGEVFTLLITGGLLSLLLAVLRRRGPSTEGVTTGKHAEELRESEWRFRTLADAMPLLIWQCNTEAKCDYFNQGWLRFTGRAMEQELGDGWVQAVHQDDARRVMEVFLGAFEQRKAFQLEYRLRHYSGEYRWILDPGVPRFGPDSQFLGYIGGCLDITDRKQAEEALRQSEERLSQAMEFAGAGMWDEDLTAGTAIWSPQHFTLLGYEPAPVGLATAEQWRKRVHPEDQNRVFSEYEQALRQHRDYRDEYRIIRADDGQVRWVSALGRSIYDETGQGVRFVGLIFDITERKRAEEALSESEARLKLAQQAGHVGVFDWDMVANRAIWTPELDEVFGLNTREEAGTYESWVKYVLSEDLPRINEAFQQCLQEQRCRIDQEYRIRRPDGQVRWVGVKGQISYLEDGRPARIIGTLADLTERRLMEDALRESEAKFRVLAENARASFGIVQGQCFVYANPYFAQISGYSVEELLTMSFPQLVHPDSLPMMLERMRRRYGGDTAPGHYDFAMLTRSGEKRWVEFSVASIEYQGQPAMIGTGFDVTERKRAEAALREYAEGLDFLSGTATRMLGSLSMPELYRFVAERIYSLADGAIVTFSEFDPSSRKTILREVWSTPGEREEVIRMLGRKPEGIVFDLLEESRERIVPGGLALVADGLHELTYRQLPAPLCTQIEQVLNIGDIYAMACAFEEDLLGLVAIATHECVPLRNKKLIESLVNQAALALKRRRVEEELRQTNARLTAANERLAEADRRKDEFLAMLAHELRNPLAPVRNAVQILHLRGSGDPALQRQREIIDRQITHMAHLLDDLLDVSRVTRGKIVLVRQMLHLADVLAHAVETAMPLVEARRHTLHVTYPPDDLCIEGDIDRLAQIVGNLLANAAKYTDEGGQIWLEGRSEGRQALIRVRDTGLGIAPEMLSQVFDLFAQADQTLGRSRGGLGIGLTMVKRLVEMHGGRVEAHSEGLGRGSEFTVRLPTLAIRPEPHPAPAQATLGNEGRPTALRPYRILVVDDVVDTADSLAELLELWGYQVRTAHDGPTALETARAFRPEVVLLDIGMPGMDGFEVTRHLRAEYGFGILLVALTGYGQEEVRRQAEQAGFNQHLTKPVDLGALQAVLERAA